MAEPQRASALPDVASRPKPLHRPRHATRPRPSLDETENLSPPMPMAGQATYHPVEEASLERPPEQEGRSRRPTVLRPPSRSPGEWTLLAAVLLGLTLNVSALLTGSELTAADRHLGTAVLLAGIALLVLMEICRRTDRDAR